MTDGPWLFLVVSICYSIQFPTEVSSVQWLANPSFALKSTTWNTKHEHPDLGQQSQVGFVEFFFDLGADVKVIV